MSHIETGIDALEGTIKKTDEWINDLEIPLGWSEGEMRIVRACLPGSWSVFWA